MDQSPRRHLLNQRKIRAYRWLYEFTKVQCTDCAQTDCACKDSICEHVETQAKQNGYTLERTEHRLRFIGCGGCVVPPHLRETCTIYLCQKALTAPGFPQARYERLKNHAARIEERIMLLEDARAQSSNAN